MYEVIYISILLHGIIQEYIFNERNKKINLLIPLIYWYNGVNEASRIFKNINVRKCNLRNIATILTV